MARSDGQIVIDVELNADGANRGIRDVEGEIGKLDRGSRGKFSGLAAGFRGVGTAALGIVGGVGAAGAAIGALAVPLVKAAGDAQAAAAQFSTVFGDIESQATASLNAIADETGIIPERLNGAFTQIAAFAKTTGVDTADALALTERATLAAADSAAFYDRSIEEVTENLQSFLKGNYENDAALGISATETTRNAAANRLYGKSFNDLSESQKQLALLDLVEQGNKLSGALGQAARESDGLENVTGNLRQAFQNLLVEFGTPLLGIATEGIKLLTSALQSISLESIQEGFRSLFESLGGFGQAIPGLQDTFTNLQELFRNGIQAILDFIQPLIQQIVDYWRENGEQIIQAVQTYYGILLSIFNALLPPLLVVVKFVWDAIKNVISGALNIILGIVSIFTGIFTGDFSKLWEGTVQIFRGAIKLILGLLNLSLVGGVRTLFVSLFRGLINIVRSNLGAIANFFRGQFANIVGVTRGLVSSVVNFFSSLGRSMISSVTSAARSVLQSYRNLVNSTLNAFRQLPGKLLQIGKDAITGLINGLKSLNPVTVITKIAGGIVSEFKERLDINSPSRVFHEFGLNIVQGLANGIRNNTRLVTNAVNGLATELIDAGQKATKTVALINRVTRKEAQNEAKAINNQLAKDRRAVTNKLAKDIAALEKKNAEANAKGQQRIANASAKNRAKVAADEAKKRTERNKKLQSDIKKLEEKAVADRIKLNKKAASDIKKIEDNLAADRLKALEAAAEYRQNNGTFTALDTARYYEEALRTFRKGSTEYLRVQKLYGDATKDLNDEITKANEDYVNGLQSINNDLKKALEDLNDTYDSEYNKVYNSLVNFTGLFDSVSFGVADGRELTQNLSDQLQAIQTFTAEIDRLGTRGISQALVDEIRELGVDALPELIALNNLTDDELQNYSNIYEERAAFARQATERQLEGLRKDTEDQIRNLTNEANSELLVLQNEWLKNIENIVNGTEQILTLDQLGKNAAQTLLDGLTSLEGPLAQAGLALGANIRDALQKGLGLNLSITNPFSGQSVAALQSQLNNVTSSTNSLVAARGAAAGNNQSITAAPVILDNKVVGEIVYTVVNGKQTNALTLNKAISGVI